MAGRSDGCKVDVYQAPLESLADQMPASLHVCVRQDTLSDMWFDAAIFRRENGQFILQSIEQAP